MGHPNVSKQPPPPQCLTRSGGSTPRLLSRRAGSDVDATAAADRTRKPRRCHVSTGQNKKIAVGREDSGGERSPPPQPWNLDPCDILDVGLGFQLYETESLLTIPKPGSRKCDRRGDNIWGAWFFFNFYFKPVLNEKAKRKTTQNASATGASSFEKSDLRLDAFLVQHDMENMYMWVFKERPENALGKMQLRSYMNGHSRLGEPQFPFNAEKGFVRSHRMQRKQYRGVSNP